MNATILALLTVCNQAAPLKPPLAALSLSAEIPPACYAVRTGGLIEVKKLEVQSEIEWRQGRYCINYWVTISYDADIDMQRVSYSPPWGAEDLRVMDGAAYRYRLGKFDLLVDGQPLVTVVAPYWAIDVERKPRDYCVPTSDDD